MFLKQVNHYTLFFILLSVSVSLKGEIKEGLTWDKTLIKATVLGENEVFEGVFSFSNNTSRAITIKEVKPSCGCTVPIIDKLEYEPGETGKLPFKVNISRITPVLNKSLKVFIEDKEQPSILRFELTREKVFKATSINSFKTKLQTSCPYMRIPIKKEYYHDVLGMRIYTCCKPCLEKVRIKPQEALRLLTQIGEYPEFIEIPTSEEEVKVSSSSWGMTARYCGIGFLFLILLFTNKYVNLTKKK